MIRSWFKEETITCWLEINYPQNFLHKNRTWPDKDYWTNVNKGINKRSNKWVSKNLLFNGKKCFSNDEAQNYLIFEPVYKYFQTFVYWY